jgi:voltage-gated sodium channel
VLNNLFSKHTFLKLKEHKLFQSIVIVVIILSAFLVGASTFKISDTLISIFWFVDILITLFFIIEIIIRFIAEPNKKNF